MPKKGRKPGVIINEDGTVEVTRPLAMSTRDASIYLESLGVPYSASTLSVWRSQSKGPVFRRVGGMVIYRKADLDRWAEGVPVQVVDPDNRKVNEVR